MKAARLAVLTPERHTKVWGEEYWVVNNPMYCGKQMFLRQMHACSYHRHKLKNETFFVTGGEMLLIVEKQVYALKPGESITIPRRCWHKFIGITDCSFFEFSTQHSDSDVERKEGSTRIGASEFLTLTLLYQRLRDEASGHSPSSALPAPQDSTEEP